MLENLIDSEFTISMFWLNTSTENLLNYFVHYKGCSNEISLYNHMNSNIFN